MTLQALIAIDKASSYGPVLTWLERRELDRKLRESVEEHLRMLADEEQPFQRVS